MNPSQDSEWIRCPEHQRSRNNTTGTRMGQLRHDLAPNPAIHENLKIKAEPFPKLQQGFHAPEYPGSRAGTEDRNREDLARNRPFRNLIYAWFEHSCISFAESRAGELASRESRACVEA